MRVDTFSMYHPWINFLFFLSVILLGAFLQHPIYLLAGVVASGNYYVLLHGQNGWKNIGGLIPLFLFLVMINPIVSTRGITVLFYVFTRPYTLEALYYGVVIAAIFVEMILWMGCYSKVLTSDKFSCLFANLLPSISLLLTMIFRMIPNLVVKIKQMLGARSAIGKALEKSDRLTVLEILTSWALEGGVITADSMRARGYGTSQRSSFMVYQMKRRDWMMLGTMLGLFIVIVLVWIHGGMEATFVPQCRITSIRGWNGVGFFTYCCYIMIPSVLYWKETIAWSILKYRI